MENHVNPPADPDKGPDQIQAEMCQTREALSQKIAALENQMVGTVQTASETVQGTVNAVKSLMDTAPGAVTDTVKEVADVVTDKLKQIFNITSHVRGNPWGTVGVSAGLGFLTGLLVFRGRTQAAAPVQYVPTQSLMHTANTAPATPGVFDQLIDLVSKKLMAVGESVIESASETLNENVKHEVPKLVNAATELAAERLTPESRSTAAMNGSGNRF